LSAFERGLSHYRAARYEQARVEFTAATQQEPGNPQAWRYLASTCFTVGDFANAEGPARQCLELTPGDPAAHLNLAIILRKLGLWDQARASLEECLRMRPDYEAGLAELAKHPVTAAARPPGIEAPEFEPLSE